MKAGESITKENVYELVSRLRQEEADSLGLVNHTHIRRFLEEWFENN